MDGTVTASLESNETSPLLGDDLQTQSSNGDQSNPRPNPQAKGDKFSPEYILPIALLSALAMSSTAATAFYAYATLLCRDPKHCDGREVGRYSMFVATATTLSNVLGLLALGYFQKLVILNRKLGLLLWILSRSCSAVALLLGISINSIYVALSGRIFEGLASDNLLHFTLNAVYAHDATTQEKTSSLIGYSLALYMAGISASPFVAGLFHNFSVSFLVAIGLFALSALYLVCIPGPFSITAQPEHRTLHVSARGSSHGNSAEPSSSHRNSSLERVKHSVKAIISPLRVFGQKPAHLLTGLSLFCYNVVQSYIFTALVVYTSVQFGFTGKENGLLISIVHSVASVLLFSSLYLIPKITSRLANYRGPEAGSNLGRRLRLSKDLILALICLTFQTLAFIALGLAAQEAQIYLIAVLLAAGLSAPSFIKAYFISGFEEQKSIALAALTVMETLGSLLGPVILGGLQTFLEADSAIFFVASGIGVLSFSLLLLGTRVC